MNRPGLESGLPARQDRERMRMASTGRPRVRPGAEASKTAPVAPTRHFAAITSISTSQPGTTSPATCIAERAGRLSCSAPKYWT